jgi:DNA-directed RNA polymerase specialized sigma24 family protein
MGTDAPFGQVALEAVRRARAWCDHEGLAEDFRAFEEFVLRCGDERTYEEVARSLGTSAPEIRRRVIRVRERIRLELRGLMGESRGNP